jgi:hypothetical protein
VLDIPWDAMTGCTSRIGVHVITADIADVSIDWGSGTVSLITAVDDWCARVLKLGRDALGEADAPAAWTVWDLIGAYFLRDAIEEALAEHRREGDDLQLPTVAIADEFLREFSVEDIKEELSRLEPCDRVRGWWWRRIPKSGPIAAETGYSRS